MDIGQVCLRRGEELDLAAGSSWIYDNEIAWCDDRCRDGDVVAVLDSRHRFVGRGFFNAQSKIAVRMLTRSQDTPIDRAFFRADCRRLGLPAAAWFFQRLPRRLRRE